MKQFTSKSFDLKRDMIDFVNDNKIEVVSVIYVLGNYTVFYYK